MTTFLQQFFQCPACGAWMASIELTSYTVHESMLWSDGFQDHQAIYFMEPLFIKCPACSDIFCREDAQMVPAYDFQEDAVRVYERDEWRPPGIDSFEEGYREALVTFYTEALNSLACSNTERETWIRTRLWWTINDCIRAYPGRRHWSWRVFFTFLRRLVLPSPGQLEFARFSKVFKENLQHMKPLYAEREAWLLLAEIHREAGEFAEARRLLKQWGGGPEKSFVHVVGRATRLRQKHVKLIKG